METDTYPLPRLEELLATLSGSSLDLLDDLLIMGRSEEEHLQNLQNVLQRPQENGLRVKRSKCQQAVQPLFSYIAKGGAWLIQLPSLSNPQPERRDVLQENFNQHLSTRLDRIANAELYDHKARRRHRTAN
ncbi:unnamed protein product [Pleuronectes platessa]|uniref:Uncharacterized protein n=1 Tax=Pleuronectes platessa TaxID=8262 RepID=A0A9N7YB63_PLEPL|nr:unnamed protein product [Pleuronectes platessa]